PARGGRAGIDNAHRPHRLGEQRGLFSRWTVPGLRVRRYDGAALACGMRKDAAVHRRRVPWSTDLNREATRDSDLRLQLQELIAEPASKAADGVQEPIEPPPAQVAGNLLRIATRYDLVDRIRGYCQSLLVTQDLRFGQGDRVERGLVRARGLHPGETKSR